MHEMNSEDTEGGEFSFVEYHSGSGLLSTQITQRIFILKINIRTVPSMISGLTPTD